MFGLPPSLELAWAEYPLLLSTFHNPSVLGLGVKFFNSIELASVLGLADECLEVHSYLAIIRVFCEGIRFNWLILLNFYISFVF